MSRSTKEYRPLTPERVVRQGGSLDDGGSAPALRSPEEEATSRASRYQHVAALFAEWLERDEEEPAIDFVVPLRLKSPAQ